MSGQADDLPEGFEAIMRNARQRFVAAFPGHCDTIAAVLGRYETAPSTDLSPLKSLVHRLTGLAGTVGFHDVSAVAARLEDVVTRPEATPLDHATAVSMLKEIRQTFAAALVCQPSWAPAPAGSPAATAAKILVADDDDALRAIVVEYLRSTGFETVDSATGDTVLDQARAERPAAILLDVNMPGLDGYSVCRLLKTDSAVAHIPVIFMTTQAGLDKRLAGLALGADEFLSKPIDLPELAFRISRALDRSRAAAGRATDQADASGRELDYQAFLVAARNELGVADGALALVRVPDDRRQQVRDALLGELRCRDVVGALDATHLLVLFPELAADDVRDRLSPLLAALGAEGVATNAGIADAGAGAAMETLFARVDEALVRARYEGSFASTWTDAPPAEASASAGRMILLADDDPDVVGIVDATMRAAGYSTTVVFDGEQAISGLRAEPDVLVLDLMMPKLNGFDVLSSISTSPGQRPKIVVLSARGREQDVTRAFKLGADDYMRKPFNPQELLARVSRLLT